MSLIKAIYIFLHVFAIIIMYVSGKYMAKSKTSKQYWKSAIPAILAYGISVGLRFGRGTDYNSYAMSYEPTISDINYAADSYEYIYRLITWSLGNLGLPFWFFVFLCSVFFIYSFILILQEYKCCAHWALLLFPIFTIQSENLIRWYLALSILLCGYKLLASRKYLYATLFAIVSVFTHTGMAIVLALILGFFFISKKIPVHIAVILMIASIIVSKMNFLSFLTPYVVFLSINEKSSGYADNYESIFIDNEQNYLGSEGSMMLTVVQILVYLFVIIISHKCYYKKLLTARQCNYTYLAIMLTPLFSSFNVLARFPDSMMLFYCITLAMCIVYTKLYLHKVDLYKYWRVLVVAFTFWGTIMTWGNNLSDAHYLYIWDSNGSVYSTRDLGVDKN